MINLLLLAPLSLSLSLRIYVSGETCRRAGVVRLFLCPPNAVSFYFMTTVFRLALGPYHSPIQWVAEALSLGVKLPGREANHSPPSSAEVKNEWSYTSASLYAFMVWCLV
jgi:hypothetical protein